MGDKMKNQKIKCDVENCKYNNCDACECTLDEIEVSCSCNGCDCHKVKETICSSFKEKEN